MIKENVVYSKTIEHSNFHYVFYVIILYIYIYIYYYIKYIMVIFEIWQMKILVFFQSYLEEI